MHDANGVALSKGDKVIIEATIIELTSSGDDYCNVTVETDRGRRPDGQREMIQAINTGVLLKVITAE